MNNIPDQSKFVLHISDISHHGIQIIRLQTNQYALDHNADTSQNYSVTLICFNKNSLKLQELINKKAAVLLFDNLAITQYFHGIITKCTDHQIPQLADQIVIHSPLYPLTLNIQSKVYHNVSLTDLIDQILINSGWYNYQYQLLLENNYPMREYVVQYQESDFDFLQRKCAFYGVFFTFVQSAERATLVFCDNIQSLPQKIGNTQLSYYSESGQVRNNNSILNIEWQQRMLTDNIRLNDYNYRTPDISLLLESTPTQASHTVITTDYRFQDHYKTIEEGQFLLTIRQQALDCRRKIWIAKTDCVNLQPGYLLQIDNHPITEMNGEFIVITITHHGDQSAALPMVSDIKQFHQHAYHNVVELMPCYLTYRPTAPEPIYQENCLANITGTPGIYASIDEYGRYLIRPKFDTSNAADDQTSHAVRLIQPLSGNHYGVHFPLHVGTEVLLTHINGDADRPIIMGVLSNMNSLSPVTSNNYTQNIIKTCGGNQLLLDDQPGHEHILLNTPNQQNSLLLDATPGQQQINIQSLQGDISLHAEAAINSNTQNNHQQIIGNNHEITVQNHAQITTIEGDINLNAATDLILKANNDISATTENGDIILQSGQNMMMNAQQDINLIVENGDLSIQTSNGDIVFQAGQDIILESTGSLEYIYIAQGGASIQITADAITLTSPKAIHFSAELIEIEGQINYGENKNNEIINNLILHYQDELGNQMSNLEGIYHLFNGNSK